MDQVNRAVDILSSSGIIIFPTDTVFGMGCRIDKALAIKKLFEIRNRPLSQATPVLVDGIEMAKEYVKRIPDDVLELMRKYWPGGLTIILPAQVDKVNSLVRGGTDNIGVRIPDNDIIISIIKTVGVPILGPSANFHKDPTPYEFRDLNPKLVGIVDFVVEGECKTKQASTVIDCTKNPWKILRHGAVSINI